MARSKNNVVMHGMSGIIGDLILFRQWFGRTIVGKIPKGSTETTEGQKQVRVKFQNAVKYARMSLADPATKKLYKQEAGNGKSAFNVAVADFFTAPKIEQINAAAYNGAAGDKIGILVTDDFMVKTVEVTITAPDGRQVEKGNAVQEANVAREGDNPQWFYTATTVNGSLAGSKITVLASDLPGNPTSEEKVL